MRTTLTLDSDVAEVAKSLAHKTGRPFKEIVNRALRSGLSDLGRPAKQKVYHTRPHHMGLRPGVSLDNVQELLSQLEGEDAR